MSCASAVSSPAAAMIIAIISAQLGRSLRRLALCRTKGVHLLNTLDRSDDGPEGRGRSDRTHCGAEGAVSVASRLQAPTGGGSRMSTWTSTLLCPIKVRLRKPSPVSQLSLMSLHSVYLRKHE